MKLFIIVLLSLCLCAYGEECLEYDKSPMRYLKSKAHSFDTTYAHKTMTKDMKIYGFGICLKYFDRSPKIRANEMEYFDKHLRLIEDRSNAYCITTDKGKQIKNDIEQYIKDARAKTLENIKSVVEDKSRLQDIESNPLLAYCFYLYESPEYQVEIERIVKKYCKECE